MEPGSRLAEGKTKIVYAHPTDADLAVLVHKDGITAGDGARRNIIPGKGALAGRTTANVFKLLNANGINTHFVAAPRPDQTVVRRCDMLPLEVVTRRLATGSYLRRHTDVAEGMRFDPPLIEYFLKDDARHDPQVNPDEIAALGLANETEIAAMADTARQVFLLLEQAWASQDVTLVDLKIEFGRLSREPASLLVADVIDNDSWRIWPGGDKTQMLDKQVYRNAREITDEVLEAIRDRYARVADMTEQFR
jgi:phosphoribosylaminoimidazole-succinocarboxamide synthase